uniref:ATP synthase subunit a n=1 Tax=Calotes mystaceus TaxID=118097 RepID=A0A7M1LBP7_9SAUR|nr:ATP synthase F0 subunit 6 [Calotes mystaceus]QOQ85765.1 ATP synthase F0 subunit 6 [Calotes mystaceus]
MELNLFDQFIIPQLNGINLMPLIISWPIMMLKTKTNRLINDRYTTLLSWLLLKIASTLTPKNAKLAESWAPLLTALFLFLAVQNLIGMLPYTYTTTTQLSLNLALAVPLWMATVIVGLRNHPTRTIAHLLPEGTPTPLIPILVVIETISLLMRPIALAVRLTANLTAGHLLLHLISLASFTTINTHPMASVFATALLLLLTALEMAVALIQAYVFALLISLYLQENT